MVWNKNLRPAKWRTAGRGLVMAADAGAEEQQLVALIIYETPQDPELAWHWRPGGCTRKPCQALTKLSGEQKPWKKEDILLMSMEGLEH